MVRTTAALGLDQLQGTHDKYTVCDVWNCLSDNVSGLLIKQNAKTFHYMKEISVSNE
jgi:hypothetical protein